MKKQTRNFNLIDFIHEHLRRILIVGALIFALIGALGLAGISQQTSPVWALTHDVQSGQKLSQSDLVKADVTLGGSSARYISASKPFVPKIALRPMGSGELLPLNAVGEHIRTNSTREISLGILVSDLPANLAVGDQVDLYLVPRDSQQQSEKVSAKLLVIGIDARSRSIGGTIKIGRAHV